MTRASSEIRGNARDDRDAKRTPCEHKVAMIAFAMLACACSASTSTPDGTDEKAVFSAPLPPDSDSPPPSSSSRVSGEGESNAPPIVGDAPPGEEKQPPASNVTADQILAKLATPCATKASTAPYARDVSGTANIDVCALKGAVFFRADMDIDCDGKSSDICNSSTDASYQNATAATDSQGNALDAAKLPYIVVPGVSSRWSYKTAGITMGTVGAVIYNGKIEYGIVGDVGPTSILGEASYAMASRLGINPNPSSGGTASGVTYVIFTGDTARVTKKEDHAEAVTIGQKRASQLLEDN